MSTALVDKTLSVFMSPLIYGLVMSRLYIKTGVLEMDRLPFMPVSMPVAPKELSPERFLYTMY